MNGVIIINKHKGCTSHDIVYQVKKMTNQKVGHTGTLDPMATGVLPLLIGKGTLCSKYLINHDKIYEVKLQLGKRTDTLDAEGKVVEEKMVLKSILEELNVKNVELGADMSQYVSFEIKPNLPVLGKEYGKYIPKIKEEIAKRNQMEVATKVKAGGTEYIELGDTVIELNSENLLITMHGKDGFAFAGEGEIGVVLDTQISEELREEGFVREILSKIQNMRKDSGFEVLDQIKIYVAKNEKIEAIIRKNETSIMK